MIKRLWVLCLPICLLFLVGEGSAGRPPGFGKNMAGLKTVTTGKSAVEGTAVNKKEATAEGASRPFSGSTLPVSQRIEMYISGARLLENGRNTEAVSFFQNFLENHPGLIEAAEAFIEAHQRICRFDDAVAWLNSGPFLTGRKEDPRHLFLNAFQLRMDRDFGGAAGKFREAADASLDLGDTLSAAFCLRLSARSALGARDAEGSLSTVDALLHLVSRLEGFDRLTIEATAIRGEANNLLDRLDEADSLYRHALQTAGERGYRQIQSDVLNGLGQINEKRQHIKDAVDYYRQALAETRTLGSTEKIAAILNNLGQVETRLRNLENAEKYLDESRALALSCGTDWILGYIYYGLGAIAEARGKADTAKTLFRYSTEHHQQQGNKWGELGARLRLAYSHMSLGEYSSAIEQYERCLENYEAGGSLYGKSWALGGLALAHHRLGNFKKAQEFYTRTIDVRQKLGDRRGIAWCLNSLGMVNDMQGNYRGALEYEHEAMEIYEALGDRVGIGSVHFSIGSVYFYLGNFSKSMEFYEKAYAIATGEADIELLKNVASGMGSVYHAAGRMDLAEAFYLEHLESAKGTGELANILWSLNNMASFYIQLGDSTKARRFLREAISLLPEEGMDHIRSKTLFLRGKTVESNQEAIDYTERALELAEVNGLKELQWKYLSDLGEYLRRKGDVPEAKRFLERAIDEVESLRRGVGSDELRRHMLRPAITPFDRMVSLIIDTSGEENAALEAFEYTERAKAQIFASLLREALSRIEREDPTRLNLQKDLLSQLSHIQSRLQDGEIEKSEKERLLGKMERIERDLLKQEIQKVGEESDYTATVYPTMVETPSLLASLEANERMLSYFLGRERSYLFVSKGAQIDVFLLPGRAAIEEKAGLYIRMLRQLAGERPGSSSTPSRAHSVRRGAGLPPEVLDLASGELYEMLLGPVADRFEPGERLVIIPDGILNRLPFSLLKHAGTCLVETHEIFYAPSLQSLHYLRKRGAARSREDVGNRLDVLTLGCSGGRTGSDGKSRVYPFTDIVMKPLPRAEEEARTIAGMFEKSLSLTGGNAGESLFKEAGLDRAEILHIAAHSYIDNEDVRRSFVVLGPEGGTNELQSAAGERRDGETTGRETRDGDTTGQKTAGGGTVHAEDGLLQWHEIAGLRLNASLVTLSACRAAGGVLAYGEGITGLTQAFLYAGGNCVLASFIDVPDRFAGRFMTVFYRNLKKGQSGAAALRAAQLEAKDWTDIEHGPALWGSFALIGDGGFAAVPGR